MVLKSLILFSFFGWSYNIVVKNDNFPQITRFPYFFTMIWSFVTLVLSHLEKKEFYDGGYSIVKVNHALSIKNINVSLSCPLNSFNG